MMKACGVQVFFALLVLVSSDDDPKHHHGHHHRHHHHHHHGGQHNASSNNPAQAASHSLHVVNRSAGAHIVSAVSQAGAPPSDAQILQKIQTLESEVHAKEAKAAPNSKGHLKVNGPLPVDFSERFARGVAAATGCRSEDVALLGAVPVPEAGGNVEEIVFKSRSDVVTAVEDQAANPESKLANGVLHTFLVAHDSQDEEDDDKEEDSPEAAPMPKMAAAPEVDMAMPYGDLEPFGREDTAQELTESSITESNAMVDQLERAEVAEEKRAVFRALTRLRGAAITSYDGIARSQTGNIDGYARSNQWRTAHPVHHLASDEADVSKWAFPDGADE